MSLYLDVGVEVAADTGRGPVLGGLEGHAVDASDELVRGVEEGADATIGIGQAIKFLSKNRSSLSTNGRVSSYSPRFACEKKKPLIHGGEGSFVIPSGETSPGVVGSSVEELELDGDVASRTTDRRVEDMARNGTTGSHDVRNVNVERRGVMERNGKKRKNVLFVPHSNKKN